MSKAALTVLLVIMAPLQAEELTLQTVLDNYRQAIGGQAAIDNIESVYVEGKTLATQSSPEMPFKAWYEPKQQRLRLEYLYLGVPGVISYDGERGWNILPVVSNRQAMPMQGADLLQIREQANFFGPLIQPVDKNVQLNLLPPQQSADGELQPIEVKRSFILSSPVPARPDTSAAATQQESIGQTSIWKLSSRSWLPQVVEYEDRLADGSTHKQIVRYSEYREVGKSGQPKIVWPHRVETDDGSGEIQINVLDEISLNVTLDQVQFDLSTEQP